LQDVTDITGALKRIFDRAPPDPGGGGTLKILEALKRYASVVFS